MDTINMDLLSMLIRLAQEPVLLVSEDCLILDINTAVEKILPLKKNLVIGKSIVQFCSSLDLEKLSQSMLRILTFQIGQEQFLCYVLMLDNAKHDVSPALIVKHGEGETPDYPSKTYQYMDTIIAEMPVSIYWMDKNFVYLGCSNSMARLLNLASRHDIVGKTYDDLFDKKSASYYKKADQSVMEQGTPLSLEEPLYHSDGTKEIYLSKKVPLHDVEGKIIGMLGISVNITDRKKMEEELRIAKDGAEAASRAKTEFIANMGHDIRTPLTGIIGMTYMLEEEVKRSEEKEQVSIIHDSGEQLLGLLNGVLELITVDSTTEDVVHQESFDIRGLLQDIMKLEHAAVEARHLKIQTHIDDTIPPYVVSDRMKLHRIILNLAGNAIKFTKEGHIELNAQLVSATADDVKIQFSVKDTGIGIPDNLQDKVFERFFKVSPSYKGLYNGNGIGLHIAQKYVDLLGGHIQLASTLGVGTTFSFVLSMKIGQKPEEKTNETVSTAPLVPPALIPAARNPNQFSVLLIEDNVTALRVLKYMVQKFNVDVSTAVDAEAALELVKSQHFDLVITDLGLPGQSGDEMTSVIRAHEQEHHLKPMTIIGLTGHALTEITQACLTAGMNEVYLKPISPDVLKKLMETFIKPSEAPPVKQVTSSEGALGMDLPDTEAQLFEIQDHPLFDVQVGIEPLGSEAVLRDIIKSVKEEGIMGDLDFIKKAHDKGDWKTVEKLTHKIKGSACYGTVRLYYALLYMERYLKAGHTISAEALYVQMLHVIDETMLCLDDWLNKSS